MTPEMKAGFKAELRALCREIDSATAAHHDVVAKAKGEVARSKDQLARSQCVYRDKLRDLETREYAAARGVRPLSTS